MSPFTLILIFLAASQLYWIWRLYALLVRWSVSPGRRMLAIAGVALAWILLFEYNFGFLRDGRYPVHLTLKQALFAAPFLWWAASSMVAFLLVVLIAIFKAPFQLFRLLRPRRAAVQSASRRHFL
jgi:hypothetical protein